MRLDKFLKVSRIIKRRTVAKEVCDGGRVTVNGRPAKAGSEVKPGDRIEIFGPGGTLWLAVVVKSVQEPRAASMAASLYEVVGRGSTAPRDPSRAF